jgi:hypothetical protein
MRADRLDQVTAPLDPEGVFALMEYTEALPRAKLYGSWTFNTNSESVLATLTSPEFDPHQRVIVQSGLAPAVAETGTNQNTGNVEFASYAPRDIVLKSQSSTPGVLLLNDHFEPHWKVQVDGKPATLLRCNFIMRGVYLEPGAHQVEFRFQPPLGPLYLTLSAITAALVLLAFVMVAEHRASLRSETEETDRKPAAARQTPEPAREPTPVNSGGSSAKRKSESRPQKQRRP